MKRSRSGHRPTIGLITLVLCCTSAAAAEDRKKPPVKKPPAAAPSNAPPAADTCADAVASARYEAYGYTHVVTLRNGCSKSVECALWTDVDPEPRQTVRVAPGQSAEITTRKGSPARELTAHKSCSYR